MQRLVIRQTKDGETVAFYDDPGEYPYLLCVTRREGHGNAGLQYYRAHTRPASEEDARAFIAWYEAAYNERVQQRQRLSKYFNGGE